MRKRGVASCVHYSWVILALCFFNIFLNYGIRTGFGAILPQMIKAMALSRRQGADIANANVFAYVCTAPLAGYLADRFGTRVIIPTFCMLLALGTLLMGTAADFHQAALFFAIVGIGGAAMWAPLVSLLQKWFVPSKRGISLGIITAGCGLGVATMGRFHPTVVSRWGWHYSWYILGAVALVMVVMNVLFLRSGPEALGLRPWGDEDYQPQTSAPTHSVSSFKKHYREIFRAPKFWVIGISYALVSGALYLPVTFMVDYAYSILNLPYGSASLLITVHGICQIPGVLIIPWLSDLTGRRPAILVSDLVLAAGTVSLLLSRGDLVLLYLSVGILGALFGAIFVLYSACAGDYFPKELVGSVVGIWTPFYGAGLIIAQRLGGYIRDVTGSFLIPFVGAAVCAVVAAGLILGVQRTRRFAGS